MNINPGSLDYLCSLTPGKQSQQSVFSYARWAKPIAVLKNMLRSATDPLAEVNNRPTNRDIIIKANSNPQTITISLSNVWGHKQPCTTKQIKRKKKCPVLEMHMLNHLDKVLTSARLGILLQFNEGELESLWLGLLSVLTLQEEIKLYFITLYFKYRTMMVQTSVCTWSCTAQVSRVILQKQGQWLKPI